MTGKLVCFVAGVGLGVVASRRLAQSPHATAVGSVAGGVAERVRSVLDDAIADGRLEMQRHEARLREVLAAPVRHPAGVEPLPADVTAEVPTDVAGGRR